jgi:hypothetical protein
MITASIPHTLRHSCACAGAVNAYGGFLRPGRFADAVS